MLTQHCARPDGGTDLMKALETALEDLASPERFLFFFLSGTLHFISSTLLFLSTFF